MHDFRSYVTVLTYTQRYVAKLGKSSMMSKEHSNEQWHSEKNTTRNEKRDNGLQK